MSSTQNPNPNSQPSYEDFDEAKEETQETEDAHLFIVHAPGLTKEQVGANYEAAFRRIRVFGEKPIENNKRKRFSLKYIIPENCEADKLRGHFEEGAKITIRIPKKKPIIIAPKEQEQAQEGEGAKQVTSPKSASDEVESEANMKNDDQKGISEEKPRSEIESGQRESDEKESKMPQRDEDTIKESVEDSSSNTEEAIKGESRTPQEGKGIPQEEENKNDKNQKKTSEEGEASPQEDQRSERDQKSKEEKGKESAIVTADESSEGLKKTPSEKKEKETSFQKDHRLERDEKGKESAIVIAAETSDGLKKTLVKEKEKQMVSEYSSTGLGNSVTRLAKRFSEEDKQKLLCAGAAILVVVVGIYASFKLRSLTRQ